MTAKKNPDITKSEALSLAWKNRADYKGYEKGKGSLFNVWRSVIYTTKGKKAGFPKEWCTFEGFKNEVGSGWKQGLILCRLDTKQPYSKENVEWREKGQEQFGKLIKLEYNGESKTLLEWCVQYNLNYSGVRQRYFRGKNYTSEQILFGKYKGSRRAIKDANELTEQEARLKALKMLGQYKLRDKKRGFEYNIDSEWFIDQIKHGECYYCGDTKRLGLDRIDNSKGYTMNNIVVYCYDCNVARGNNFSHEEMRTLGRTIQEIKRQRYEN